jgi:predicted MPP superfamily phosphohydrolase
LAGNELPWFENCHSSWSPPDESSQWELKIAVAHSPDQFPWAIKLHADLMLCGHTHGGHARFPLIGPIVAPSWYGSRYASGLFCRNNTVMHVSRGLSGVHPVRFWCVPEVSILELHGSLSS